MNNIGYAAISSSQIKEVVSNYNTLDYTPKLRELLHGIYPTSNLKKYGKLDLHKKINELVLEGYEGEQALKYRLFQAFQNSNLVGGFEIKVKKSRLDFLTINGHTTSYEIKSSLDNLDKLSKQSGDYLDAFEFNNVVIHDRHLKKCIEIIPASFGIITASKSTHKFFRKPVLNKALNPQTQLSLLTKKEISTFFNQAEISGIPSCYSAEQINEQFKLALKSRYQSRWGFVVEHAESILPIDLQFFFNKNIDPQLIYG